MNIFMIDFKTASAPVRFKVLETSLYELSLITCSNTPLTSCSLPPAAGFQGSYEPSQVAPPQGAKVRMSPNKLLPQGSKVRMSPHMLLPQGSKARMSV